MIRRKNTVLKVTALALAATISVTTASVQVYADEMAVANEAVEAAEASCETLETITEGNTEAGLEAVSYEDGGAIAQESVEAFAEAAENLNAAEMISEAADDLQAANEEIAAAMQADTTADEKAAEAVGNAAAAADIANSAANTVAEAKVQANDLIDIITNTGSDGAQVNEALEKLDTLTGDAKEDLEAKKEVFDAISDRFEKAKNELAAARKVYEETVKVLKSDDSSVAKAAERLEDAKQSVEALSEAYDNARAGLEKEQALVEDINAKKAISDKNTDWKTQNALMKSIMVGYIIPNMIDKDATNITFSSETQRGFDRQNSSYCVVKYLDKDNNEVTRYFNIDRTDRQYKETDQWYKLGSSREIVIYEKPEEDITSSLYQIEHYGKKNVTSEFKADVNAGVYDVYAFDYADGSKEYKCIDEIEAGIESGDVTVEDGVYYMNGAAGRKIVQTTGKNATGIRVSTKDDAGFRAYIENAAKLVEKYEKYDESIADAQDKIDEAIDKVEALEDTIEGIEENKVRVAKAVAGDLGNYLSEEDVARIMAADSDEGAIEILEGILVNAKNEFENASAELDELIVKCEAVKKQLVQPKKSSRVVDVTEVVAGSEAVADEAVEMEETGAAAVEEIAEKAENTTVAAVKTVSKVNKVRETRKAVNTRTASGSAQADSNKADVIVAADGESNITAQVLEETESFDVDGGYAKAGSDKGAVAVNIVKNNEEPFETKAADNAFGGTWWVIVFFVAITKIIGKIKMYF